VSELLEAFRASYLANNEAFNRMDFETAFANLPDDVVWDTLPEIVDWRLLKGKQDVLDFFQAIASQWPDWRVQVEDITEPEPGLMRVRCRASGTGALSGAATETIFNQDWDFRSQPLRITERLASN
jgi:ketosteroid isomerase-like protein